MIIPPGEPVNNGNNSNLRRESVLLKLRQYIASFIALVTSVPIIYTIQKSVNSATNPDVIPPETADEPQMMMKSTESVQSVESACSAAPSGYDGGIPEPSIFTSEPVMILIAMAGGAAIFLGGFLITRFFLKEKRIL